MNPASPRPQDLDNSCLTCSKKSLQHVAFAKPPDIRIMIVGISGKALKGKELLPLSRDSRSGSILTPLFEQFERHFFYKTNLVKCHPTLADGKTRYPNKSEISNCKRFILHEINEIKPKLIFLLGKIVTDTIFTEFNKDKYFKYYTPIFHCGTALCPIHHPSYISIYKRKQMPDYISQLANVIRSFAFS